MEFLQQLYQRLQPEEYPWLWEVCLLTLVANFSGVLLKTLDIIDHHGAEVACPTSTLKLDPVMVQAGASSSGDS